MYTKVSEALAFSGIALGEKAVAGLTIYLEELLRWNQHINLTAIQDPDIAIEKHIVDSLLIMKYVRGRKKMLDIGSGGGLPGVPLALVAPNMQVVSLDASSKKINFQRHIRRKLSLDNFLPINQRIEKLALSKENSYDLIVSRAFSSLEKFVEGSLPFQQEGGLWLAMKGSGGPEEVDRFKQSALTEDLLNIRLYSYNLPISNAKRTLFLAEKRTAGERGCN